VAIEERTIRRKGRKPEWEVRATGKDVNELKGLMREASERTNEKNEALRKEIGMVEMETSSGKRDVVREDGARRMERKGFRPVRKSFVVPDLPWLRKKER